MVVLLGNGHRDSANTHDIVKTQSDRLRAITGEHPSSGQGGWTGMLGGTSRGVNHDYEMYGIRTRGSGPTGCDEPDPVTSRLA